MVSPRRIAVITVTDDCSVVQKDVLEKKLCWSTVLGFYVGLLFQK